MKRKRIENMSEMPSIKRLKPNCDLFSNCQIPYELYLKEINCHYHHKNYSKTVSLISYFVFHVMKNVTSKEMSLFFDVDVTDMIYKRMVCYYKEKQVEKAVMDCNLLLKCYKMGFEMQINVRFQKVLCCMYMKEYGEAISMLNVIVNMNNVRKEVLYSCYYNKGKCHFQLGYREMAIRAFSKAAEVYREGRVESTLAIAEVNLNEGKFNESFNDCMKVLDVEEFNIRAHFLKAKILVAFKKFEEAKKTLLYVQSVSTYNYHELYYYLGYVDYFLENHENAISEFDTSIKNYGDNNMGEYFLPRCFFYQGKIFHESLIDQKRALFCYKKAIEYYDRWGLAYYNRGKLLSEMFDYNGAINDLTKVITLDSEYVYESYLLRAKIFQRLTKYSESLHDFSKALDLKAFKEPFPDNDEIFFGKATCYLKMNRYKDALEEFELIENKNDKVNELIIECGVLLNGQQ